MTATFLLVAGHFIGIDPFDESIYLGDSTWVSSATFQSGQAWAPLYLEWYKALGAIFANPLPRYFLSWSLIVSAVSLLPALFRVRGAWLYTLALLSLPFLAMVPYVSMFAATLLVTGMCLLVRWGGPRPFTEACALACVAAFAVAYVRPEFGYGVLFAAAATLIASAFEFRAPALRASRSKIGLAACVLLTACLAFVMHNVMVKSVAGNRSAEAFVEHFNLRAQEKGLLRPDENPWLTDYTQRTFHVDTGNGHLALKASLGDYFRASPRLFLGHILANLLDRRTLVLLLILLGAGLWVWRRDENRALRPASLYLALISLPPLIGILVIYPRDHYALILVPSLTLLLVQLSRPWSWPRWTPLRVLALATIVLVCLGVSVWRVSRPPFPKQRTNLARTQCAQMVDRPLTNPSPIIYDTTRDLTTYLPRRKQPILPDAFADRAAFENWAATRQAAWIAMDDWAAGQYRTSPDEIDRVLKQSGYVAHVCPAAAAMTIYVNPAP